VGNAPARTLCGRRRGEALRRCFLESVDPAFLDSYLVDFAAHRYPAFYTPAELREFVTLELVVATADGSVYRVSPKPGSASSPAVGTGSAVLTR